MGGLVFVGAASAAILFGCSHCYIRALFYSPTVNGKTKPAACGPGISAIKA
jgi:hypothetical protein